MPKELKTLRISNPNGYGFLGAEDTIQRLNEIIVTLNEVIREQREQRERQDSFILKLLTK